MEGRERNIQLRETHELIAQCVGIDWHFTSFGSWEWFLKQARLCPGRSGRNGRMAWYISHLNNRALCHWAPDRDLHLSTVSPTFAHCPILALSVTEPTWGHMGGIFFSTTPEFIFNLSVSRWAGTELWQTWPPSFFAFSRKCESLSRLLCNGLTIFRLGCQRDKLLFLSAATGG